MNKIPSENKSIDDYITTFPKEVGQTLQLLRNTIREEIPSAQETISYAIPTFKLNGTYLIYFAGYKKHISLYPISEETIKLLKDDSGYKLSGKGTIQFSIGEPLPIPLIRKIVRSMLEENLKRREKDHKIID